MGGKLSHSVSADAMKRQIAGVKSLVMEPFQIPLFVCGSTREAWKRLAAVKSTVGMVLCLGDSSEAEQRMTVSDLTCSFLTHTHTHTLSLRSLVLF